MATILSDRIRMGDRTRMLDEHFAVYFGALVQGATAVIFAVYTSIFIAPYHYDLTLPQYGTLFIGQVIAAVLAAIFVIMGSRLRAKRTVRIGLSCSLVGIAMLVATEWAKRLPASYPLLLSSAIFVGAGLGLTFPNLRCHGVCLKPLQTRRQILLMNALLVGGMAGAAGYALGTWGTSAWWSLPILLGVSLIAEMLLTRSLRAPPDGAATPPPGRKIPARFRIYPALALLYGICAVALISAPSYLTGRDGHSQLPFLALAEVALWPALVAGSRVVFAIIDGMASRQYAASIGFFMIAVLLLVLSVAVTSYYVMHVALYLLVAIGCAALLPIDTRPGYEHLAVFPLAVAAGLISLFPAGVGLSRSGLERMTDGGVSSFKVFISIAVLGAVACILLLPIILSWQTMAYFDRPAARTAGPPGTGPPGGAGLPGTLSAPAPRRPHDDRHDGGGDRQPGGATALPPRWQSGPRRHSRLRLVKPGPPRQPRPSPRIPCRPGPEEYRHSADGDPEPPGGGPVVFLRTGHRSDGSRHQVQREQRESPDNCQGKNCCGEPCDVTPPGSLESRRKCECECAPGGEFGGERHPRQLRCRMTAEVQVNC
jgi:hypothetical protein